MKTKFKEYSHKALAGYIRVMLPLRIVCIMLLLLIAGAQSRAQDSIISLNPARYHSDVTVIKTIGGDTVILPVYIPGDLYRDTIPLVRGYDRSNLLFIYTPVVVCSENCIQFNPDSTFEIPAGSTCSLAPGQRNIIFEVQVIDNNSGLTDKVTYVIPLSRQPVKIVFVLDVSGSMTIPTVSGGESRLEVLKKAVNLMVKQLCAFSIPKDSAGLTYFTHYLIQANPPIDSGFTPITRLNHMPMSERYDTIMFLDMKNRTPLALTAMGKGLLDGKKKLQLGNTTGVRKIVFLFTDGLQNQTPMVDLNGLTLAGGTLRLNDTPLGPEDTIHYYTTGICAAADWPLVLQNIAAKNSGYALQTSLGTELELQDFFDNHFQNMLSNGSPQIVFSEHGKLSGTESSDTFELNAALDKLFIRLCFKEGTGFQMKLEHNGQDFTPYARFMPGPYYQFLILDFPVKRFGNAGSEGKWMIKINGFENSEFSLVCFADDHLLKFKSSLDKSIYTVGDPIRMSVQLNYAGKPLTDASNKITALLLKPGEDIGHLLATLTAQTSQKNEDVLSGAEQKFMSLLNNDSLINALLPSDRIIPLTPAGNGLYTGKFDSTQFTGIYKIYFFMKGTIPGKGIFERQNLLDAVFKFGQISTSNTPVSVGKDSTKQTATITIRPINKYKKYLGPGFLSHIKLEIKPSAGDQKGKWVPLPIGMSTKSSTGDKDIALKEIIDLLDGRYAIVLDHVTAKDDPLIRITVMDEVLRAGKLSQLPYKCVLSCWAIVAMIILILILLLRRLKLFEWLKAVPQWIWWIMLLILLILQLLKYFGICIF